MSLREKGGKWEFRFRLNGDRISEVTDLAATEQNRAKALKLEQRRRDAILKGEQPAHRLIPRGFSDAVAEFLAWCEVQHAAHPNTAKRVATSMVTLRAWFGNHSVAGIRRSSIEQYKVHRLHTHKVQPITLRHDLDALSKFFEWAIVMEVCAENPVRKVEKPSSEDAVRMHVLTAAEEMEYFHRIELAGYRNLAGIARIILDQGLRPDEAYSLERRGVDLTRGRITIFKGKSKAARRTLRLTAASLQIVSRRYEMTDGKWLFPSDRGGHLRKLNNSHDKVCAAWSEQPGRPARHALDFVLYDLRHTFATRAAERGMPLTTLAAILGHSSLRMVTKYVHPTQEHMDAEMDRLGRDSQSLAPSWPHTTGKKQEKPGFSGTERERLN